VPVRVCGAEGWEGCEVTADVGGDPGATASLHAAARTRPALNKVESNRE